MIDYDVFINLQTLNWARHRPNRRPSLEFVPKPRARRQPGVSLQLGVLLCKALTHLIHRDSSRWISLECIVSRTDLMRQSRLQDKKKFLLGRKPLPRTGLIYQADQVAASRDLSLLVRQPR